MSDFDVVVVGGRVAGASTALLLARAGARVALVDRGTYGSDTLSTHGLMRAGVLQLTRWGLLPSLVAAGTPAIRRTAFHYADGETVEVALRPTAGVEALYAPRRLLLDRILVDAAAAAGAEIRHETTVTSLLCEGDRVVGVRARDQQGRAQTIRATVTVGADGVRSTIAARVGAPVVWRARSAGAVLYRYYAELPTIGYEWAYGAGVAAGLIPTNDGLTCVFASAPPSVIGRGGVDVIVDAVAAASPELADGLRTGSQPLGTRSFEGHQGFVRRSHGPGWALVGDAGTFKDPIGAHGITDALRDAELLARAVIASSLGAGSGTALAEYEHTRDRVTAELFDVVDRIAGHEWDEHTIGGVLKQLSASMADELDLLSGLDAGAAA